MPRSWRDVTVPLHTATAAQQYLQLCEDHFTAPQPAAPAPSAACVAQLVAHPLAPAPFDTPEAALAVADATLHCVGEAHCYICRAIFTCAPQNVLRVNPYSSCPNLLLCDDCAGRLGGA